MLAERLMMAGKKEVVDDVWPGEVATEYIPLETITTSKAWTAPENGYFLIEVFGASGKGGKATQTYYETGGDNRFFSGGGGGGGGYARSAIKLRKGDTVTFTVGSVGGTTTAAINGTAPEDADNPLLTTYSTMSVSSGANGGDGIAYSFAIGAGGSGGVASGGNWLNQNGSNGAAGNRNLEFSSSTIPQDTVAGGAGGAAGYSGGNAGGVGAGFVAYSSTQRAAGAGKSGFAKVSRGNTNVVERPTATASTSPTSSVTYTDGIADLAPETLSLFSQAISENSAITRDTTAVYIDAGELHRKISVANQISLSLNGTAYAFDVIGFNHDSLTDPTAYGLPTQTGRAGITFQMHDVFATLYAINSTMYNTGGWKTATGRTETMPLLKGYLQSTWQAAIKAVDKVTSAGGYNGTTLDTVSDELFLPSVVEVVGTNTNSLAGEGYQYAYYKAGNSKVKSQGSTAKNWWLRSPRKDLSMDFCLINTSGSVYTNSNTSAYGMAPAFCI